MAQETHTSDLITSMNEIHMVRESIRGEFEPGKYLRDMGTGAAAGAAAGAVAGAGIGSLPGVAVGAIGGTIYGLGSNAVADIAYQVYGNEGKAAWQAADMEAALNKMGGWINGKTQDQHIGQFLSALGSQYKNYIDVAVNKATGDDVKKVYEKNIFNPKSQAQTEFNNALPSQATQYMPRKSANSKFVRLAYEDSAVGIAGGTGAGIAADQAINKIFPKTPTNPVVTAPVSNIPQSELLRRFWMQELTPADNARVMEFFNKNPDTYRKTLEILQDPIKLQSQRQFFANQPGLIAAQGADDVLNIAEQQIAQNAAQGIGKTLLNPKNILNATWKGVKGMGVGLAVDFASNWTIDKIDMALTGGEINMFRRELSNVGKVITEINRLTANNPEVVYAGNILWTNLKAIDRMLSEAEEQKKSKEVAQNTPLQPTASRAKFKRIA